MADSDTDADSIWVRTTIIVYGLGLRLGLGLGFGFEFGFLRYDETRVKSDECGASNDFVIVVASNSCMV